MDDEDLITTLVESSGPGFDELTTLKFLEAVEELGDVTDALATCHLTRDDLLDATEVDPALEGSIEVRKGRFKAELRRRFRELAMHGVEVPIIGGKDKDEVVATQTITDPTAMKIVSQMYFSPDMAQYTRQAIVTEDRTKREKDTRDQLDTSVLTRAERSDWDRLLGKMQGRLEKAEEKK